MLLQGAEAQRVLRVLGRARGVSDHAGAAGDQRERRDLHGVGGRADDDHPPAGPQAADGGAHRGGCGHRGQDRRGAAEGLQGVGHVGAGGIDVVMGAERPRLLLLVRAAGDRHGLEPHPAGELHAEMAEAADAEDGDEVARTGAALAQRVEGGDARAEQRRGVLRGQVVRDRGQRALRHHDVVGVAAVVGDAGHQAVDAADHVAAPARVAVAAVAAEPADPDALAHLPGDHGLADGLDPSGDLVPGDPRVLDPRYPALDGEGVGVADPAGLHPDEHLARAGIAELPLGLLELRAGAGNLHHARGGGHASQ